MQFKTSLAGSLLFVVSACGGVGPAEDPAAQSMAVTEGRGAARNEASFPVALGPVGGAWHILSPAWSPSSAAALMDPVADEAGVDAAHGPSPSSSRSHDGAVDVGVRGRGEAGADAPSSSPSDAADAGANPSQFAGLHVSGNRILDVNGNAVRVQGVNRSGSEFACVGGYGFFDGPTDTASVVAMKSWNINAVRVLLNEDCWLGINGVSSAYSGPAYQQAIEDFVSLLLAHDIYPILDLHWSAPGTTLSTGQEPMADADHAPAFWTSVAGAFKSNGSVILELFNEPWPDNDQDTTAAWTCWRDGGSCPSVPFRVAGMQQLVDVVRATGATNLLLLGGVEYSNALSQWVAYKPTDPLNNLAAAWHVYQGNACSDTACFDEVAGPVALAFPIIATEVGDTSCDGAFMTTVMQWLDAQDQSYTAWTWNVWGACSTYSLVLDYAGTPNGAYGLAVQAHFVSLESP